MTEYEVGRWYGWNGGECPVHPKTVVEVAAMDDTAGSVSKGLGTVPAERYTWSNEGHYNPIIAFRVIKEHREPREVWLAPAGSFGLQVAGDRTPGAVLFREVLE